MTFNHTLPEAMVIYAFRYCLGRSSYASAECTEYLLSIWDTLTPLTQALIVQEINKAIEAGECGMEMDRRQWMKILERNKQ